LPSCAPIPEEARQIGKWRDALIVKRRVIHPISAGYYTLISDLGGMIATRGAMHKREKP
jgi:hypothetical protein